MYKVLARDGRDGSTAKGWAIGIALGVHIVALCVLAALTFARPAEDNTAQVSQAAVGRIRDLSETAVITPKPKVVQAPILAKTGAGKNSWNPPFEPQEQHATTRNKEVGLTSLAATTTSSITRLPAAQAPSGRIEFFGNYSDDRKVCFVVDCSGSMSGLLGQVVRKLKNTIDSLEDDQFFYVIFFGGNTLHEYGDGKMLRATKQNKYDIYQFAKVIKPSGKTDSMRAIKRAMEITGSGGNKPAVIYFLTDGFELDPVAGKNFCQKIEKLRRELAPNAKINTIGFLTQENDRPVLKAMANQSGGRCTFVTNEK